MADEEATTEEEPAKRKLPIKMIIVIAIVMIVEGAIFGAGFMLFGDKPPEVSAEGLKDDEAAAELDLVEVLLIGDKFQNTQQGAQTYLYDASIYLVVQRRHQEHIQTEIEANVARINGEITTIFARAEPAELNDPERTHLKRKILAACKERFGRVPGSEGQEIARKDGKEPLDAEYYVLEVVISSWKRFSSDL